MIPDFVTDKIRTLSQILSVHLGNNLSSVYLSGSLTKPEKFAYGWSDIDIDIILNNIDYKSLMELRKAYQIINQDNLLRSKFKPWTLKEIRCEFLGKIKEPESPIKLIGNKYIKLYGEYIESSGKRDRYFFRYSEKRDRYFFRRWTMYRSFRRRIIENTQLDSFEHKNIAKAAIKYTFSMARALIAMKYNKDEDDYNTIAEALQSQDRNASSTLVEFLEYKKKWLKIGLNESELYDSLIEKGINTSEKMLIYALDEICIL